MPVPTFLRCMKLFNTLRRAKKFLAVNTLWLFASTKIIQPRAVVPQILPFALIGERQLQKSIDGVRIFNIQVRIVGREDHIVFQAVFGDMLCRDLVAFHCAVALALKVFERRQL